MTLRVFGAVEQMVREHDFVDGICRWCGGRSSEFLTAALTCIPRWVEQRSRATPTSIFNDLASIGERMREIQTAEQPSAPDDLEALEDRVNQDEKSR